MSIYSYKSRIRATAFFVLALAIASLGSVAAAANHLNVTTGETLAGGPLALRGYDPVAFFTRGAATAGSAEHSILHNGAVYRFASAENQTAFEKSPERYLPAYGGFCAYGVAVGAKFDGDPRVFRIVDDRLYLNLNPQIQGTWEEDVTGNVAKANRNWTKIRDTPVADLK